MMMSAHSSFPNLRSPESAGEIRKGGSAISARALVAEISRRFRAPQMTDRANRPMMMSAHSSFHNLRSPESVGEIRKGGGAISARALVAKISRRFRAPQMTDRANRPMMMSAHGSFPNLRSPESVKVPRISGHRQPG